MNRLSNFRKFSWLRNDFVHSSVKGALDILLFDVARDCDDNRLFDAKLCKVLPHECGALVTVHLGHVAIHEHKLVHEPVGSLFLHQF